ncbi:hypothetical protein ACXHXG_02200 [Rhizobium sp. LEGMi198b]
MSEARQILEKLLRLAGKYRLGRSDLFSRGDLLAGHILAAGRRELFYALNAKAKK